MSFMLWTCYAAPWGFAITGLWGSFERTALTSLAHDFYIPQSFLTRNRRSMVTSTLGTRNRQALGTLAPYIGGLDFHVDAVHPANVLTEPLQLLFEDVGIHERNRHQVHAAFCH